MRSSATVDVWNRALVRVGQTKFIQEEDEQTPAADVCRRVFDDCLGEALEMSCPDWAKTQYKPNLLPGVKRAGWTYAYALPPDFVVARCIVTAGLRISLQPGNQRIPYEIQKNDAGDGKLLCTDADLETIDALEYTSNAVALGAMPRLFISAVVHRLAAELAPALVKGKEGRQLGLDALQLFEAALAVAGAADANQHQADPALEAESIRARR